MATLINIRHTDREWHEAFLRFAPRVFPSISFRRWYELGAWDEGYQTFSIVEGDEIVANASLQRMNLIVGGRRVRGWQFGAVGTLPTHRGRGLQRRLIPRALELAGPHDLVFLFANDTVTDFYPRFGFRRLTERWFRAEQSVAPAAERARQLRLDSDQDRALLARIASQAQPVTARFGAADYGTVLLWYWANFYADNFHYIESDDAIVVMEQEDDLLRIVDVLAPRRMDLRRCLPSLATRPVSRLEFGFTPEVCWPDAVPAAEYLDSPLFVRGPCELPQGPFKFPMLAQT
jgi:GNAT superfamily N-acetyltransferase